MHTHTHAMKINVVEGIVEMILNDAQRTKISNRLNVQVSIITSIGNISIKCECCLTKSNVFDAQIFDEILICCHHATTNSAFHSSVVSGEIFLFIFFLPGTKLPYIYYRFYKFTQAFTVDFIVVYAVRYYDDTANTILIRLWQQPALNNSEWNFNRPFKYIRRMNI